MVDKVIKSTNTCHTNAADKPETNLWHGQLVKHGFLTWTPLRLKLHLLMVYPSAKF